MKYICALISFKNPQKIIYRTQFSILVFILLRSLILLGIFLWRKFKGLHLYKPMNPCHEDIISLIRYWELGECFESMSMNKTCWTSCSPFCGNHKMSLKWGIKDSKAHFLWRVYPGVLRQIMKPIRKLMP